MIILGNGQSRAHLDLKKLTNPKIGCNAIFRDTHVDHVVCIDRRMVNEALSRNVNQDSKIYTREEWFFEYPETKNLRVVPTLPYVGSDRWDEPFHWGSGPYAVLLGAKLTQTNEVSLIGFDLYGVDDKINNIYKDTLNYDSSQKRPIDPRYWIYQIGKVFEHFPDVSFTIFQTDDWMLPKAWKQTNVEVDSISNIYYNT